MNFTYFNSKDKKVNIYVYLCLSIHLFFFHFLTVFTLENWNDRSNPNKQNLKNSVNSPLM